MTSYSSREELENLVVTRHRDGWSGRSLAKDLGISRNTVRKILKKVRQQQQEGHDVLLKKVRAPSGSKLDAYVPQIEALLEEYRNITGQRVFEELQDADYDGGVTILREKLQELRPKPKREPVVRFETAAGEQGQMDWSPYKLMLRCGHLLAVVCFSYILAFSRRQYIDFVEHRDFYTLIRRHQAAFEYFNGVPRHCLYDSEKTVVLRWEANQPICNPSFLQFITHYECRPVACLRGRPRTKGKVEAPFSAKIVVMHSQAPTWADPRTSFARLLRIILCSLSGAQHLDEAVGRREPSLAQRGWRNGLQRLELLCGIGAEVHLIGIELYREPAMLEWLRRVCVGVHKNRGAPCLDTS
jgi:transposase